MSRVLVIEDERDIREAMAEALAGEGYDVSQAKNGMEGLREAHEHLPNLILLDLMMPVMDGWQFRAAQRGDPEIAAVPVVVVSAAASNGLDAAAYLNKPFDLIDLLYTVEQHAIVQ